MRIQEFLKEFLSLRDRSKSTNFANNSRSCRQILMKFVDRWDVSLATNRAILVVIWITFRIQEF